MFDQFLHALIESHQCAAYLIDLIVAQCSLINPAERLPLHELLQQLHEGENERDKPAFDVLRICVDPWMRPFSEVQSLRDSTFRHGGAQRCEPARCRDGRQQRCHA